MTKTADLVNHGYEGVKVDSAFAYLRNKSYRKNLIIILILIAGLILGLVLIRYPQIFRPQASAENVEVLPGDNVKVIEGEKVVVPPVNYQPGATIPIKIKLTAPSGSALPSATPTPAAGTLTLNAVQTSCTNNTPAATLTWTGTPGKGADADTANKGKTGFYVDISTAQSFDLVYNKFVETNQNTGTTPAPSGFVLANANSTNPPTGSPLSLTSGTTYYARVFNGAHSNIQSFIPSCSTGGTGGNVVQAEIVISNWGKTVTPGTSGDISNNDGFVNSLDFEAAFKSGTISLKNTVNNFASKFDPNKLMSVANAQFNPGNCTQYPNITPDRDPDGTGTQYRWRAECGRPCTVSPDNASCSSLRNDNIHNIDGAQTYWCYGFNDGPKCMQLEGPPKQNVSCAGDEQIAFEPVNPRVGQQTNVRITSRQPSVNVGLSGPFNPTYSGVTTNNGIVTWTYTMTPTQAGRADYNFTVNNGPVCTSNFVTVGTATSTVVGYLDDQYNDCQVRGWAAKPNTTGAATQVDVRIYRGDKTALLGTVKADKPRTDLAASRPELRGTNYGFEYTLPDSFKGTTTRVFAYAIDPTDPSKEVKLETNGKNITCNASTPTPTPTPTPSGVGFYKLIEIDQGKTVYEDTDWKVMPSSPLEINHGISGNPGVKTLTVMFKSTDGRTETKSTQIRVVSTAPEVANLTCNIDVESNGVAFEALGKNFDKEAKLIINQEGQPTKTAEKRGNNTDTTARGLLKNADSSKEFSVQVQNPDQRTSNAVKCQVNSKSLQLRANVFCQQIWPFDVPDVEMTFIDRSPDGTRVSEKVTIGKDGFVKGVKSKLQVGKNYALAVKAPKSLRKVVNFQATAGTDVIDSLILPVGDIWGPGGRPDGVINTNDRSRFNEDWRALTDASEVRLSDFNQDRRVNSFDWACMRQGFNQSDDPIPGPDTGNNGGQQPQTPSAPTIQAACTNNIPTAAVIWNGRPGKGADADTANKGKNGFYVDISTTSNFTLVYNKFIETTQTNAATTAPSGFVLANAGRSDTGSPLTLQSGTKYYVRVFNGNYGTTSEFTASCTASPTPSPTPAGG